jgi:hypothetical protein
MRRDIQDEELDHGPYGDVVTSNMQRIKDSIYGTGSGHPMPSRSGPRTSGRQSET